MFGIVYVLISIVFFIVSCITSGKVVKRDYGGEMDTYFIAIIISLLLSMIWPITIVILFGLWLAGAMENK